MYTGSLQDYKDAMAQELYEELKFLEKAVSASNDLYRIGKFSTVALVRATLCQDRWKARKDSPAVKMLFTSTELEELESKFNIELD